MNFISTLICTVLITAIAVYANAVTNHLTLALKVGEMVQ